MPKEALLTFFKELGDCSVMGVTLTGGEAFTRSDLPELIDGIVANRMRYKILSNGTLITDELARFLKSTSRCDFVQVSIDGSDAETHDTFRGSGVFEKAVKGALCLLNNDINVTVRVTIHKHNYTDLENIAKLLLDEIGLPSFSTNSASRMGLCRANSDRVELTAEENSIAMAKLVELNKKYNNRIGAAAGPLANARQWMRMSSASQQNAAQFPNGGRLTACNAMMRKLTIRADGVITPCGHLSHIELGRVNVDKLADIWLKHEELNRLRNRRFISLSNFAECRDCEYMNYCTGNCPAVAYNITGSDATPSPDSCLKRFLNDGGRLPETNSAVSAVEN